MVFARDPEATAVAPNHAQQRKTFQKQRHSYPSHFDPEELSRKLTIIQAEQRVLAEKLRIARAEPEQGASVQRPKERSLDVNRPGLVYEFQLPNKKKTPPISEGTKAAPTQCHSGAAHHAITAALSASSLVHTPSSRIRDDGGGHSTYRHVPQVAALQFARTTTNDPPNETALVHRLSKMALKCHSDALDAVANIDGQSCAVAPCDTAKAWKQTQRKRDDQNQRNQFQNSPTMLPVAEINETSAPLGQESCPDMASSPKRLEAEEASTPVLPAETLGSPSAAHEEKHETPRLEGMGEGEIGERRVDWTQSDEARLLEARLREGKIQEAKLRKSESKWRLVRHWGGQRHKDFQTSPIEEGGEPMTGDTAKSLVADLFPRFKRHGHGDQV